MHGTITKNHKKIALIGSAPSSTRMAPFGDPSWTIWGCSPGAIGHVPAPDAWFELHAWRPENPCCEANYVNAMKRLTCPIYMVMPQPELPTSVPFPKQQVLAYAYGTMVDPKGKHRAATFNPNDFGSSLSWMMALAIMQQPDEIGLWGIDMAANEEYGPQKDGMLALIHIAKSLGIRINLPIESDLIRPQPLYGYQEHDHQWRKLNIRLNEVNMRINDAAARERAAHDERLFLEGARDCIIYDMRTWVADPQAIHMQFSQPGIIEDFKAGAFTVAEVPPIEVPAFKEPIARLDVDVAINDAGSLFAKSTDEALVEIERLVRELPKPAQNGHLPQAHSAA